MSDPRVSVVMGVYNGADYLKESIQSVLTQTLTDFEFIIVNDGSTDKQVEDVLEDYAARDQRISVFYKRNEGLTRALIDGCAAAKGTYIARIDNGDIMMPNRLQKQSEVLEDDENIVCVSCSTEIYGPEWEYLYAHETKEPTRDVADSLEKRTANPIAGIMHHGSVMFRRDAYEAVGGYRSEFYYGQDMDLWYRLADMGSFETIPACLYQARLFPESISAQNRFRQEKIGRYSREAYMRRQKGESEIDALRRAAALRPDRLDGRCQVASGEGAHFIAELLRRNQDPRCRSYFRLALKQNPFRLNSLIRFLQSFYLRAS